MPLSNARACVIVHAKHNDADSMFYTCYVLAVQAAVHSVDYLRCKFQRPIDWIMVLTRQRRISFSRVHLLRQLHWLDVQRRMEYRVVGLVHQSLSGLAPAYLADDVNLITDSGRHLLQSAVNRTCVFPRTHNTFDDNSFTADDGPRVWNNLPSQLRQDISYGQVKRQLKTFLFVINWPRRVMTVWLFEP